MSAVREKYLTPRTRRRLRALTARTKRWALQERARRCAAWRLAALPIPGGWSDGEVVAQVAGLRAGGVDDTAADLYSMARARHRALCLTGEGSMREHQAWLKTCATGRAFQKEILRLRTQRARFLGLLVERVKQTLATELYHRLRCLSALGSSILDAKEALGEEALAVFATMGWPVGRA